MPENLDKEEIRILGALVEKQLTTPEYYPLTLNALINACNQKNNRDPIVSLDEKTVSDALERLRDRNLAYIFYGSNARVAKYKHMLPSVYELEPSETAVIAVLMLRGPQTIGELRERTGRMHEFTGLDEVQTTLDSLARRDESLVVKLERQPGQKDARFAHLLGGEIDVAALAAAQPSRTIQTEAAKDRVGKLESEIERLSGEIAELRDAFAEFSKQFE
jgi:uncharacterized protein YceH (UPF0502 family)